MTTAYVDSSWLVSIAFDEPGATLQAEQLGTFNACFASNLLETELRAALRREEVTADPANLLAAVRWIYPSRPLTVEIETVLQVGYVRGADLWHLACALFLGGDQYGEITFLTLDKHQSSIARQLGLRTHSR